MASDITSRTNTLHCRRSKSHTTLKTLTFNHSANENDDKDGGGGGGGGDDDEDDEETDKKADGHSVKAHIKTTKV